MIQSNAFDKGADGIKRVNPQVQEQIIDDLTSNEFFRLLRVIHGRMNLDPLYEGFCKYYQNIIDTNATYLPQSLNVIPFYQEISILLWRFLTLNTVSNLAFWFSNFGLFSTCLKTSRNARTSTR